MRIEVVGEGTISQQARTYAEYRVFAALTQFSDADKVQRVRVLLRPVKLGSGCDGHRLHRDCRAEGIGLLSDPQNGAPRLCRNQPRGRTHQSERGDRNGGPRLYLKRCPCHALLRCALRVALLPMVRGAGRSSRLETNERC